MYQVYQKHGPTYIQSGHILLLGACPTALTIWWQTTWTLALHHFHRGKSAKKSRPPLSPTGPRTRHRNPHPHPRQADASHPLSPPHPTARCVATSRAPSRARTFTRRATRRGSQGLLGQRMKETSRLRKERGFAGVNEGVRLTQEAGFAEEARGFDITERRFVCSVTTFG